MFEGNGEFPWLDIWPWPALFRIQAQIRTLVVKQRDPTSLYLDSAQMSRWLFDGFKNLVELTLTAPLLILRFNPYVQVIDPLINGTGLPNSLKTLRIFVGLENFYDLIGWLERFLHCVPATGSGVREYWHCWGFTVKLMMGTTYDFFMEWLPTCNQHTQQQFLNLLEDPGPLVITTSFLRQRIRGGYSPMVNSQDRADFYEQMIC
jgi:hypothetical protein